MQLSQQEKSLLIAGAKAMYAASPQRDEKIYFADIVVRLEQKPELDKITRHFVSMFTDKALQRTEVIISDQSLAEEVHVRASIVKEIYAQIKEKLNDHT
jgi:hypothetical protein